MSSTVWVLEVGHYDDARVLGVFSTLEAAKAVPVVEDEVYSPPPGRPLADPSEREWDPPGTREENWYRRADGGHITEHTLERP